MSNQNDLLQCYNRGCGKKFDPKNNEDGKQGYRSLNFRVLQTTLLFIYHYLLHFTDSCRHHPGLPVFHDAYKGWGCCNKKCTDFTEFLNIKGCTLSKHSNVKPPEPEKPEKAELVEEIVEVRPIIRNTLERPPFDTPVVSIQSYLDNEAESTYCVDTFLDLSLLAHHKCLTQKQMPI